MLIDCLTFLPLSQAMNEGISQKRLAFLMSLKWNGCLSLQYRYGKATKANSTLSKVLQYARHGWPSSVPEALKPFEVQEKLIVPRKLSFVGNTGDCA